MKTILAWMLAIAILSAGCKKSPPPPAPAKPAAPAATVATPVQLTGTASITGSISLAGATPTLAVITATDPACAAMHVGGIVPDERYIVNPNGTLQNVFVRVKSGLPNGKYPVPTAPAVLNQKGCLYTPRVLGVQIGQDLHILNSDGTLHNVHSFPTAPGNKPFNFAQITAGTIDKNTFKKSVTTTEIMLKIGCDIHPWMRAYIGVLDHPFFDTTGAAGTYRISGLPYGTYTLEAWHEKFGVVTTTLTVKDGETNTANLTFTPPPPTPSPSSSQQPNQ